MTRRVLLIFALGILFAVGAIGYVKFSRSQVRTVSVQYDVIQPVSSAPAAATDAPVTEESAADSISAPTVTSQRAIVQQDGITYYADWIAELVYDSILAHDDITEETLSTIQATLKEADPKDITDDVRLLDPAFNTKEQIVDHLLGMVDRVLRPIGLKSGEAEVEEMKLLTSFEREKLRLAFLAYRGKQSDAQNSFLTLTNTIEALAQFSWALMLRVDHPPVTLIQYVIPRIHTAQNVRERWIGLLQSVSSQEFAMAALDRWEPSLKSSAALIDVNAVRDYLPEYKKPDELFAELRGIAERSLSEARHEARRLKAIYDEADSRGRTETQNSFWRGLIAEIPGFENVVSWDAMHAGQALLISRGVLEQVQSAAEQSNRCALLGALCSVAFALEDYRAANGAYPDTIDAVRPSVEEALAFLEGPALGIEYEYRKPVSSTIHSELRIIKPESIRYARTSDGYVWRMTGASEDVATPVKRVCWRVSLPTR